MKEIRGTKFRDTQGQQDNIQRSTVNALFGETHTAIEAKTREKDTIYNGKMIHGHSSNCRTVIQ